MTRVTCLMGTYGRYELVCESLACFLQQTTLSDATMLIYNQYAEPMVFEHPRVRVVNETPPPQPLRSIKQRMVELADAEAELIHFWDDDDLCLPWHLEDALAGIGEAPAWKPASAWFSTHNTDFALRGGTYEGSWLLRRDFLAGVPMDMHADYTDHPAYLEAIRRKQVKSTEFGARTSYIYRWANGADHLSARLPAGNLERQRAAVAAGRNAVAETRRGGVLVPAELGLRWLQLLDGVRTQVSAADYDWLQARLFPDG